MPTIQRWRIWRCERGLLLNGATFLASKEHGEPFDRLIAMKTSIFCFAFIANLATSQADAAIIAGPISNPANGHEYYLLAPGSWSAAEAEAEEMGGKLAVIRNKDAQSWVFSTFGNFDDVQRGLWIGLHRKSPGGEFVWVDGTSLDYTDWYPNEPNNAGGLRELRAHALGPRHAGHVE